MWPFKNYSGVQSAPLGGENSLLPTTTPWDEGGSEAAVFGERPPLKAVVKQLLLLAESQWREERGNAFASEPHIEGFSAVLQSGARVLVTRQVTSSPSEGELLKTTYQLFIDQDLVASYFEYNYVGGGQIIGGEYSLCELYRHITQERDEEQNNSREWRAAKEGHVTLRSKAPLG